MVAQLVKAPVYQQLNDLLRELIASGEFKTGERFLTERQVAERFEVSRATANKALSNLVSERLLEFRKGLGTFVKAGGLDVDLGLLVSFTARAAARGKAPSTKVLNLTKRAAAEVQPMVAQSLGVKGQDQLIEMHRLRSADGVPVIWERRFVVARHCPSLDAKTASGSLYTLWTQKYKLRLSGAEQTIRAVAATTETAALLKIKRGAPCLVVTAVGFLTNDEPLWWEETVYRGDVYEFRNRLGGRGNTAALDLA